ncbi:MULTISPECIES: hypothetical protein [Deinococcus]|uniref:DUF1795 domain-containing protein n=1 Tax=Deinococcus cavernae TaxID=2320857 RepID=A0A418VBG8_9DEIO|nr:MULTISPECIES: hypothetical protein [Deinococcus]RJF73447.1 hypothetical protein D3875_19770 [Deinococcus cavernae]
MKRVLSLVALSLSTAVLAQTTTGKVGDLPLAVDLGPKVSMLNDAWIRKAYPRFDGRPDAVFRTEDGRVTMTFQWREAKLAPSEVERLATEYPAVLKSQVPGLKTLKANVMQLNGKNWAQIILTAPGQSDDLRRELLMTSLKGRMLVVTIQSNVKDFARNEAQVRAFTSSLKSLE